MQVGSFARRDYAERMAKQVTAKGYAVEVAGPDDHGLYRVRSAPQSERAAAVALKQKMQASGLKPDCQYRALRPVQRVPIVRCW